MTDCWPPPNPRLVGDRHALLLGAGFSAWAAGLPVASRLFDFRVRPFGPREAARLKRVQHLKGRWDTAHPDGEAKEFIAHALGLGGRDADDVVWYIARRLSEGFILHQEYGTKADVRQVAAYALGKIGDPRGRDRLLRMTEKDRSKKVREMAEMALAWLDGAEECDMDLRDFWGNLELE